MESLNHSLLEYKKLIQETYIQEAYKGLIQYIKELRKHFKETYLEYNVSGNLYQGYMDLTFFTLTTKLSKKKDLKYMVVFIHDTMQFEVWLSGRNREIMSKYHEKFSTYQMGNYVLTEDKKGMSAIISYVVVDKPDFDNLDKLTDQIDRGVKSFINKVESTYLVDD